MSSKIPTDSIFIAKSVLITGFDITSKIDPKTELLFKLYLHSHGNVVSQSGSVNFEPQIIIKKRFRQSISMDLDQRMLFPSDFLLKFKLERCHHLSRSVVIAEGSLPHEEALRESLLADPSAKIHDHPLVVIKLESIDPKEIFGEAIRASGNNMKALECLGRGRKFLELMLGLGTAASEIHPVAKAVMAAINVIYKELQEQEKIDDGAMALIDRVARCTIHIESLNQFVTYSQLRETLQDFQPLVEQCTVFLQRYWNKSAKGGSIIQRLFSSDESESLRALGTSFDQFQQHLDRGMAVQTSITTSKLEVVNNQIANDVTRIDLNVTLNNLVYAENCDWHSLPLCLPGTRTDILRRILGWVDAYQASLSGEVLLITGLAGSGKSAIARSIAQSCSDSNILLSSFFFDREVAGKDDPKALISTIAYDLGKADTNVARRLSAVLESRDSRRLVSKDASILWQFDEILLKGCHGFSATRAFVIIIDALDEGHTTHLIQLLGSRINQLPKGFRLVVTSRPDNHVISMLSKKAHVQTEVIDMEAESNWRDLRKYVEHRAKLLVEQHEWLGEGWPGNDLIDKFVEKAEGLFLWVSTIFDYLSTVVDPSKMFVTFASELGTPTSGISAEKKMDNTYRRILERCNWKDPYFVEGYHRLMGAIMAAKTPLSAKALHSLHDEAAQAPITTILNPLRCLLSGLGTENRPI